MALPPYLIPGNPWAAVLAQQQAQLAQQQHQAAQQQAQLAQQQAQAQRQAQLDKITEEKLQEKVGSTPGLTRFGGIRVTGNHFHEI